MTLTETRLRCDRGLMVMLRRCLKMAACPLVLSLMSAIASAATYQVSSIAELTARISSAVAGDTIVVQNGAYTTTSAITITRVGTAANPIVIRAETIGGVEINGTSGFNLNSPAAYITIQGFKFTHAGNISISSGTSHCRFTRNIVELAIPAGTDVSYFNINGDDVEIDRNELRNKSTLGEMLDVAGSGSQVARRLWVHHNYFHDFTSPGGNGAETIRLGLSGLSLSTGNAIVEYNLFVHCNGENELISNKSSGNTYRYNTFLDSPGAQLTLRHGNDCVAYGNYFRNTDGLRVYGDRHQIFANYFQNNTKGIDMGNGDGEVADGALLTSHDRPDNCVVAFNTFITNTVHYQMGGRTGGLGASNIVVANNLFQGSGNLASISSTAPYIGTWSGNMRWNNSNAGNMPPSGYTTANPLLAADVNGILHIQSGSAAIGAALGSFPYVTVDMDGQPRDASPDVGADEFSGASVVAHILTTNDVGLASGLTNQVSAPSFSPFGGNYPPIPLSVTITSATAGASIRYTTNGSNPGPASGTLYTGPVTISSNTTLRAIAYQIGFADSSIVSASYTLGGPISFEAEDLPIASVGATTAPQSDTNNSGGIWIALLADGIGDYVEYTLPGIPAGIYQLVMAYKAHPNRGILSLTLDGNPLGDTLDQYANPPAYPEANYGPLTFLTTTSHILRQTVTGLNAAAGAYTLSADKFTLVLISPLQSPDISGVTLAGTELLITATNGIPGTICCMVTSSNIALPIAEWITVATNVVGPGGGLNLTNVLNDDTPGRFFRLRLGP